MIKRSIKTCILLTVMASVVFLMQTIAGAAVYTSDEITDRANTVYVVGNPDFFPIEYYNDKTDSYEGAIPKILDDISEKAGVDFIYIHNGMSRQELMTDIRVELISACVTDSGDPFVKNSFTVLPCTQEGKDIKIGWAYTSKLEEYVIEEIEECANALTEEEINGYLLASSGERPDGDSWFVIFNIAYILLIALVIAGAIVNVKKAHRQIAKNEMTDTETGIGSLGYFERCFEKTLADGEESLYNIAYIIIDSNYLEAYYGEAVFKEAIKYTAGILKSSKTKTSYCARITENGFVFAYRSNNLDEAVVTIKEIMERLNGYIKESDINRAQFYYYTSLYRLKPNEANCELILFNLRKNCSNIIGTNTQLIVCDEGMMRGAADEKIYIESVIHGLSRNEFKLYLQFIVDNKTKDIVSAEALSRWDSPERGLQPPSSYIAAMERAGQISRLDYYMFEMCCRQFHKWRDTKFDDLTISCNFARSTLSEPEFVKTITHIAKRYVFDAKKLVIEITEDTIEKNFEQAISNIRQCKDLGYKIALDDMGTGYTSLLNMCDYPIDIVKIDREILLKTDTENGKGLFSGIVALAHSLGCKVVCEGVETEEQQQLVGMTECDMVQGWYYSRVFPAREGEEFAENYNKQHG